VRASLGAERRHLRAIRKLADLVIDTSKFNVHELRAHLTDRFKQQSGTQQTILVSCVSFGYKHGLRTTPTWCSMCAFCQSAFCAGVPSADGA